MSTADQIARLEADLAQARDAAAKAEASAGAAASRLRQVEDELAACRAAQAEWDTMIGHIEAERAVARDVAAELEAVRASRTWKTGSMVLAPVRKVRRRSGDDSPPNAS